MLMEELILKHKYFQAYRMKNNQILDPLTKTIARGAMVSYIKYLIKHQIPFVMGVFDVDNFKNVNDTYGHQIGDEILTGLTYNIMNCFGSTAVMGRYGGDEFLVVSEGEKTYAEIDKDSIDIELLYKYLEVFDSKDDNETWYSKIQGLAKENGYAESTKLYKENPDNYKGHIGDICEAVPAKPAD